MEVFPYIMDVILFAFAVYWMAANYVRPPGEPTFGLFRYREGRGTVDPMKLRETPVQKLLKKR